jgi:RNA polymerase subunit RPABC4/transcription elongation factor Spt4
MRESDRRTHALLVSGALLALLIAGSFGVLGSAVSGHPALLAPSATFSAHPAARVVPAATLHGDLVVDAANSPYLISPTTSAGSVYVQEGNITVLAGGTLIVDHESLQFLQFISNTGTLAGRYSHIFTFDVQGKATFENSSLTTDSSLLNAYSKLTVNVSGGGALTLINSTFEFPGWLNVYGTSSSFTANQSTIRGTATLPTQVENMSLVGDNLWAPVLSVAGGAAAVFDNSSYLDTYKDNSSHYGALGPLPLESFGVSIDSGHGYTVLGFNYPTDSENLSRALMYPSFLGGTFDLYYNTNTTQTSTGNSLNILGTVYPLGPILFNAAATHVAIAVPADAIAAVNAVGPMGWLESTGAFDDPATTGWTVGPTNSINPVNFTLMELSLTPDAQFNITVTGGGTTLTAADSVLDLNWNLTPGGPFPGTVAPTPWGSNKLELTDGATAFLANITIVQPKTTVFWNDSAILPDASSTAYLYRWAEVPVEAAGGVPVIDAQLTAFYSYDSSQTNNATATSLNTLGSVSPALAAYAAWWDSQHGVASYGSTNVQGDGFLLLADGVLQQSTLPDGVFLGGYHVAVRLAGLSGADGVQWGYAALTAYPGGMTPATADEGLPVSYNNYLPDVSIGTINLLLDDAPATNVTVDIGSTLNVQATIDSTGTAPVLSIQTFLFYGTNVTALSLGTPISNLIPGATAPQNYTWVVNQSTIGLHGTFIGTFTIEAIWNTGSGPNGGSVNETFTVGLGPSPISFSFLPPSGTLHIGTEYLGAGNVQFNGTGDALINVTVISSSGVRYQLGTASDAAGPVQVAIDPVTSMTPGVYEVIATAAFNGATATVTVADAFTLAGSATPPVSPLDQKYGPFTLLEWIVIAVAAIAAVLIGLFVLRRSARGKMVECGECGTPIPESATVCPKCGAEFETEIVRCSRCGSTIPATSEVCPECAAQLLGDPNAEKNDPERQGYNDLVERYRAESKRELGDNYNEGAFWDWWKRQGSYVPFSQWKLQQGQGGPRAGMGAPPADAVFNEATASNAAPAPATTTVAPPRRPGGGAAPVAASPTPARPPATAPRAAPAPSAPVTPAPASTPAAAPAAGGGAAGMKPCSNCGKEIPPDYLVCPFCGAVTQ